ncbi:glycosyltransferase, partial [Candidatus Falkowbacteria bacterium]|nr:glycosyltransferase [Candidatus Falkowbacteria bacterium]
MPQKLISIIIPAYNEEKNIPLIYGELLKIFDGLKAEYDYEVIFIDDGSQDKSPEILENLTEQNNKV